VAEEKRKRQKPGDKHYVNNKEFHAVMLAWNYEIVAAHYDWVKIPVLPKDAALMIKKICQRLATMPNFSGYTYKDEMILDALANCMIYATRYKAFTYDNPFAYFTQIAYNAFIYRIKSEKKEVYTKARYIQQSSLTDIGSVASQAHDADMNFQNSYVSHMQELYDMNVPDDIKPITIKQPRSVAPTTTMNMDSLFE